MMLRPLLRLTLTLMVCGLAGARTTSRSAPADSDLRAGFLQPPVTARPRVWWHWMNGNITVDGVRKDLEWMQRIGLGGVQNFDAALATPQIVAHRLAYMSPEWQATFREAVRLADSLGLEFAVAASPGWSETGGPWVPPRDAMKKLVWSELEISGGKRFHAKLPPLPEITGAYQDMPFEDPFGDLPGPKPAFHADALVLAVPLPAATILKPPTPAFSSARDGAPVQISGTPGKGFSMTLQLGDAAHPGGVVIEYPSPQTFRSLCLFAEGAVGIFQAASFRPTLELESDGAWRRVADVPLARTPTTISFAPVTARRFRLLLNPVPAQPGPMDSSAPGVVPPAGLPFLQGPAKEAKLVGVRLLDEAMVNNFQAKAGFSVASDYYALDDDVGPELGGIDPKNVVDLTGRLGADGQLDWMPPRGRWRVLRLGYSLLGTTNHPATAEATGLEVDKYDGEAVRRYLEKYITMYANATGPELIGAHGLKALVTDSIEVGPSNWTPKLVEQFRKLRGYDPTPWLPALTGTIIGSRKKSDEFLYDFRRTLADLIAREHYGEVADAAHAHGLKVYGEALESGRPVLGDDMSMRSRADVPMSALWTYPKSGGPQPTHLADMKGASSVAHIYGQNLVAAESLTAANFPWAFAPVDLRPALDVELAMGVNRPVIHTSVHQPVDDKVPGLSLLVFGQYFTRHETWASMARPWIEYIARNAFLLQQGRDFADVAYFYGEERPLTELCFKSLPEDAPVHYAYDFVSADALLNQLKVEGRELIASGGARYRLLYLGGTSRRMTLPVLKRIAQLVESGATVVGTAPEGSPSLSDDPVEFSALVQRLFTSQELPGKGRVIAGRNVEAALTLLGVAPDFMATGAAHDARLLFVHRRLPDADLYFVSNRQDRPESLEAAFRVTGKRAELWHADAGTTEPVSYRSSGTQTTVPLLLPAGESTWVVFRDAGGEAKVDVPTKTLSRVGAIESAWEVSFEAGRGAPAQIKLAALQSLSDNPDPGVRYFSGIATYGVHLQRPATKARESLWIDLGQVGDVAEVLVNGRLAGTAWKPPYRVELGPLLRAGDNLLEVRVADVWVNRLIGDAQPGAHPITFTTLPTYLPTAPLRPAGLIGPVTLWSAGAP